MLNIQNLTKSYGDKKVVNNLSLEVKKGELFGFIGHNGAGKTTTLKSICGILNFDEGDIFIDGNSIKTQSITAKQQLAYIPDNPDIYNYMKGIDYLNFIADMYKVDSAQRNEIITSLAEKFELLPDLNSPVSGYSHGMKQKLALISAFVHSPRVLILDEPFVGLDPKAGHTLKELMREMCDGGGCIFFSTHVLEVAQNICDKIAIIKQGELVVQGDTQTVCNEKSLEQIFLDLV